MGLTTLIIDDEPQSRGIIKEHLLAFPDIKLLGMAESASRALEMINTYNPDLLFLDVSMPGQNGFDLLKKLQQKDFMVVFITAHQEYAVEAFDARAIHYLLKPIDQDKFQEAINRCFKEVENKGHFKAKQAYAEIKLSIPTGDHHLLISSKKIIRIEADGSYSNIYTVEGKKYTVSKNIKFFDELLVQYGFFRIHKSHLVNLNYVEEYTLHSRNFLILTDKTEINISFRKRKEFIKLIRTHDTGKVI